MERKNKGDNSGNELEKKNGETMMMPEIPPYQVEMGRLGLCQSCGVEWGESHVTVEATVVDRNKTRVVYQMFWLCKECQEELMRKMGGGNGQAEKVAWSLTHG